MTVLSVLYTAVLCHYGLGLRVQGLGFERRGLVTLTIVNLWWVGTVRGTV